VSVQAVISALVESDAALLHRWFPMTDEERQAIEARCAAAAEWEARTA
jgi:hypothetical protein